MIDSIFAFIDPVSAVYYGGSGCLRAYQSDYVIDRYVKVAVIWRTHNAPLDKYNLQLKTCIILYAYNDSKCLLRFFIP